MYTEVADKLVVTEESDQFSQAVAMNGGNAVYVEAVGVHVEVDATITIEASNDLQNWTSTGVALNFGAVSYQADKATGIAAAYVRLRFAVVADPGTCIFAAGINVANL